MLPFPPPSAGSLNCNSGHLSRQCNIRMSPASKTTEASLPSFAARWSSPPLLTAMIAALYLSLNPISIAVWPIRLLFVRTRTFNIWCLSSKALRTPTGVSLALITSCIAIVPFPPVPSLLSIVFCFKLSLEPSYDPPSMEAPLLFGTPYLPFLRRMPPEVTFMLNDERRLRSGAVFLAPRREKPPPSESGPVLWPPYPPSLPSSPPRGE